MARIPSLRHDQTLFRDIDVFEPAYVPEQLHHRDAQTRELVFLISPAIQGASPMNAILRGPPGTGKTTTVRQIFHELTRTTRDVIPVYVDCRQDRTPFAVYRTIFEGIFNYALPSAGRHPDDIKESIVARLRERRAALIVCLDDADYLIVAGTYNTLHYQILRLYEKWDVRKPGIVAVTSDLSLNLYAEADASVRSVFHPTEINFWPYTKPEIRDILGDRVRQGLYPGVVPAPILDRIARITALEQDIRVGIDLVRVAALRAEKDGRRKVRAGDVTAAARAVTAPVLEARAAGLSAGERTLLSWIAEQSRDGGDMTAVFEDAQDYIAVGKTAYHEHLTALARAGLIDLVPRAGRGQMVRLRYPPDEVNRVCVFPDDDRFRILDDSRPD